MTPLEYLGIKTWQDVYYAVIILILGFMFVSLLFGFSYKDYNTDTEITENGTIIKTSSFNQTFWTYRLRTIEIVKVTPYDEIPVEKTR